MKYIIAPYIFVALHLWRLFVFVFRLKTNKLNHRARDMFFVIVLMLILMVASVVGVIFLIRGN